MLKLTFGAHVDSNGILLPGDSGALNIDQQTAGWASGDDLQNDELYIQMMIALYKVLKRTMNKHITFNLYITICEAWVIAASEVD